MFGRSPDQQQTGVDEPLQARLEVALDVVLAAGERTMHYFRHGMPSAEAKADGSPVTVADREAEAEIRRAILGAFPEDGILGEEFGEQAGESGYRWILDPIDGTKSFVLGVPLFGMLLAIEARGRSEVGIIHMPALDEGVYAVAGGGAWHRPAGGRAGGRAGQGAGWRDVVPARVSETESLKSALLCTTSFSYAATKHAAEFLRLAEDCRSIRGWSDCYAHLLVATGRAEAAIEPQISIWDVAPMIPIMREAGGMYTDWNGLEVATSPTGLSSNGRVHEAILSTLRISAAGVD